MTDRSRLNKTMDELFPQESPDSCRVCNDEVVDGRWNYCSERCRDIANAVQKMFLWDPVRDQILERDDHTCQECGLSKEMWQRAYMQMQEMVYDFVGMDGTVLDESAMIDHYSQGGFHVDHIQRIADGGHPFDESNLQTLCEDCHEAKTAEENASADPAPDVTLADYMEG